MLDRFQVDQVADQIQEKFDVRVSLEARELITLASRAMQEDPHPLWRYQPQFRQFGTSGDDLVSQIQLEVLEDQMPELAASLTPKDRGTVTFFHVLHWFTGSKFFAGWPVPKDPVG